VSKRNSKKIGYKIQPTIIPVSNPFPSTWEIKFFRDLDEKEQLEYSIQLYVRSKDKENCKAFDDLNPLEIYSRLNKYEHFMMVCDKEILNGKEIGLIGFIWYDGGSNSIQTWSAPLCTSFTSMFQSATAFNQPLTSLVNTSGVVGCTMNNMFQSATSFNQNIGGWNLSNVTVMASMFQSAIAFNNGGSV